MDNKVMIVDEQTDVSWMVVVTGWFTPNDRN